MQRRVRSMSAQGAGDQSMSVDLTQVQEVMSAPTTEYSSFACYDIRMLVSCVRPTDATEATRVLIQWMYKAYRMLCR
jgi:hypothetical protein